jgi:hypothetical protein
MKFNLCLLLSGIAFLIWACSIHVPQGQYHLQAKKRIQTFNPSSPQATMLIFKNEYGQTVTKRVFVDTFTLGDCYYFKRKP